MSGAEEHDPDLPAAEYVLGTLDRAERAAFDGRLAHEAGARAAVAAWDRRLGPLARLADEIAPPPEAWARIQAAIEAETPVAVTTPPIRGDGASSAWLRRSRDRWRRGAAAAAALAAALVGFVVVHDVAGVGRRGADATYVAAVNRGGEKPALIVTVDMRTRRVFVRPVAAQAPAGHSLQLWYIGAGTPPRSMGLVSDASARLTLPGEPSTDPHASFAVSLEPMGGSTTGAPTGAVLFSGQLVRE